jgi:hypothetical protein
MCAATGILPQKNVGCFLSEGSLAPTGDLDGRLRASRETSCFLLFSFIPVWTSPGKALRKVHGVRLTHIDHSYS